MNSTQRRASPSSGRDKPVPNNASTTTASPTSDRSGNVPTQTSQPAARRMRNCSAASGARAGSGSASAWTRQRSRPRCRAAAKPSPPLLPLPHSKRKRSPIVAANSATARAAFSINRIVGMPSRSAASRSIARASSAVIGERAFMRRLRRPPCARARAARGRRSDRARTTPRSRSAARRAVRRCRAT